MKTLNKLKLAFGIFTVIASIFACGGDVNTDFTTFDKGQCKIDLSSGNTNTICRK